MRGQRVDDLFCEDVLIGPIKQVLEVVGVLGLDEVVLAQVIERLPSKVRSKVPGTHLQITPSFLDFLNDESGVEGLAQAAVKDMIAIVEGEDKTLSQLVVVLVNAKIVEQLLAIQLRETTHNELKVLANVPKLPVDIELMKIGTVVFPGTGIIFITHVCRRGPFSALVLGSRLPEVDEVLIAELRINQGLIGVKEVWGVTETGLVACTWIWSSKRV